MIAARLVSRVARVLACADAGTNGPSLGQTATQTSIERTPGHSAEP